MMDGLHSANLLINARDAVHQFAHYADIAGSGREVVIKRRGKPTLKLVRAEPIQKLTPTEREALLQKTLAFRFDKPYGKKFERSDGYDD